MSSLEPTPEQFIDELKQADRPFFDLLDRGDLECIRKITQSVKAENLAKILPADEKPAPLTNEDAARIKDISNTLRDYQSPSLATRIKQFASLYFSENAHENLANRIFNDLNNPN